MYSSRIKSGVTRKGEITNTIMEDTMQATEKLTLTSDAPGKSLFMLGNEAIARGAIEAGIQVYAAYPGTPSSEISETLINLSKELKYYAEWSVNEQVAFEVAYGA